MEQMRFFSRRRKFKTPRPRKIVLSERGIYEPVRNEEDVVRDIVPLLWGYGIPVFRQRERTKCKTCKTWTGEPSEAGHPDLHGWVPRSAFIRWASTPELKAWARFNYRWPAAFYLEVKRPDGGDQRFHQKAFIERGCEHQVPMNFVCSWADVREVFSRLGLALPMPEGLNEVAARKLQSKTQPDGTIPAAAPHPRMPRRPNGDAPRPTGRASPIPQ